MFGRRCRWVDYAPLIPSLFRDHCFAGFWGNLKLAQELARHKNIAVTTRYAHLADDELDMGYFDIFE